MTGILSAVFGVALFWWTIHDTGVAEIGEGIGRVGWGFVIVLALSAVRVWARAWAWALCTDGERRLRLRDTIPGLVTGDALGNLTPLGLFVSEPTKAAFVRHRVSLMHALAGIAVENILYTLTVAIVIAAGVFALLYTVDVPAALRTTSLAALLGVLGATAIGAIVLARQWRVLTGLVGWLDRRDIGPVGLRGRVSKLRGLEDSVYGFAGRHGRLVVPVLALEAIYHLAGVAEVYATLWLVAGASATTLLTAFLLESVNRTITVIFKFVPLRLGVDEAGTGWLTEILGLGRATGVTLALVRKARVLVWTALGVLFLVQRGLSPAQAAAAAAREQEGAARAIGS